MAYFECISAIDIKQFEAFVENPDVSAILIGGYDDGNMPAQMKYYIATAVNSYNKPVAFVSTTDNGVAEIDDRPQSASKDFIKAGGIALADTIKESGFQKLCFALGLANKQKGLEGREKIEFVRKILHTNLTGEISNRYALDGDRVYKDIFSRRTFSDNEIDQALISAKESPLKTKASRGENQKKEVKYHIKKVKRAKK